MPVQNVIAHGQSRMIRRINPGARIMAQNRRRTATQTVPNKKKYNRKKDKYNANKARENEITKD